MPDDTRAMPDDRIAPGKLPAELLERLLRERPRLPPEVLVGPRPGEDACAIEVGPGVLVAATDPITFTSVGAGRAAVVVNANDVAVTGARPRWFLATVLLPEGTTASEVRRLFDDVDGALASVGAHLVGGHTEVTGAVRHPVVVGHMLGVLATDHVVTTGGVRPGDAIVQAGPAPVEGAAVLAQERVAGTGAAPDAARAAVAALDDPGISVVPAALASAELGATAMHDPTEGGLAGGLWELATAAGVRLDVDRARVVWFEAGVELCRAAGADPWATLASGALLAAFPADVAARAVARLRAMGHRAAVIAEAAAGEGVRDTAGRPIPRPERDETARLLSRS